MEETNANKGWKPMDEREPSINDTGLTSTSMQPYISQSIPEIQY